MGAQSARFVMSQLCAARHCAVVQSVGRRQQRLANPTGCSRGNAYPRTEAGTRFREATCPASYTLYHRRLLSVAQPSKEWWASAANPSGVLVPAGTGLFLGRRAIQRHGETKPFLNMTRN